ncbi:MAG: hypothetical protein NTV87_03070 [Ignavibacteriae bacterium]|jgi:soluble cytochrome b562|nr:hypothetical protein [Ignavibacteriota bacterium]
MKQKEKFYSSLIVALVAGFIYFQFADVETIRNLPKLAYKMFTGTVEPQSTTTIALNAPDSTTKSNKDKVLKVSETDFSNDIRVTDEKADFIMRFADQSMPVSLSSIFRNNRGMNVDIQDFAFKVHSFEREHPELVQDVGIKVDFGEDYVNFASFGDNFMHDSNKINIIVKMNKLDSINIYLDKTMEKLDESMEKLNKELAGKDFSKMAPKIDKADIEIEIDMSEFNEGMKEFEENMKDFKFDMKDFEEGMKELRKNMDGLKENMKELEKNQIKKYKIKVEEVES